MLPNGDEAGQSAYDSDKPSKQREYQRGNPSGPAFEPARLFVVDQFTYRESALR